MKKYATLLIAIAGLLIGLAVIVGTAALSGCAVPKKLSVSTHSALDSTATSSLNAEAEKHVTAEQSTHRQAWTDSIGCRVTTVLTFAPLTAELISLGVKSPPIASATQTVEGADVRKGDNSVSEGRYQADTSIKVEAGDSVAVRREVDVVVDEGPAPDPYRWRYIFWTVGILAVVAGGWWVTRRFR